MSTRSHKSGSSYFRGTDPLEDRCRIDVLTQVCEAKAALDRVALLLLADHTEHSIAEAIEAGKGGAKVKELNGVVARLVPPWSARRRPNMRWFTITMAIATTDMQRDYIKEYSPALGREMELLHFGHSGRPLLAFPTSQGRFYQWEDFGLVGAISDYLESGAIQLVCVDSADGESWYARDKHPADRVRRHLQYEAYIVEEILPRLPAPPLSTGASFGALHAILIAVRHPSLISGFIGMSGAYDTSRWLDGYHDDNVYFTNLMEFLPGLNDEAYLSPLRAQHPKVIVTGEHDPNFEDSRRLAGLLRSKGVEVGLEIWPGWAHDWPYWKDMMRRYLAG